MFRRGLFGRTILTVLVVSAALCLWWNTSNARAVAGPPVIVPEQVTLKEPLTGSRVEVFVSRHAFEPGTADSDTDLQVRNVTLGEDFGSIVKFNPTRGSSLYLDGAGGDLIELKATNGPDSDTALIGYVPDSQVDAARPDFSLVDIDGSFSPGSFQVQQITPSFSPAIIDNSFPVIADLYLESDPSIYATQTLQDGFDLDLTLTDGAVQADERVVLLVTDNYGNRSELHYVLDQGLPQTGSVWSVTTNLTQVDAERTGNTPKSIGDVLLASGELVASRTIHSVPGLGLDVDITLSYRSGVSYAGPVGNGWDWNLDSRLQRVGDDVYWYTGAGRKEGPFASDGSSGGFDLFDSPPGIFWELVQNVSTGEYYLDDVRGTRLTFHGTSGLLLSTSDYYGNTLNFLRNNYERVVEIQDDLGRKTMLGWFHTGQLAAVEDFGGRRVLLDYDDSGRLVRVTHPNELWTVNTNATSDYTYDGTSDRLEEVRNADGHVVLKSEYDGSDRVDSQRTKYNLTGPSIIYSYGTNAATVTDAAGGQVIHRFDDQNGYATTEVEWVSDQQDRGPSSAYPGPTGDPIPGWKRLVTVDPATLLVSRTSYSTAQAVGIWPEVEIEEWSFLTPTDDDARKRARISDHYMKGDEGAQTPIIQETWTYGPGNNDLAPDTYTDPLGRIIHYQRDGAGRLTERTQYDITLAVGQSGDPTPYAISEQYEYDAYGRLIKYWSPNRLMETGTPKPSVKFSYYQSGVGTGYLEKKTVRDNQSPAVVSLVTTYEYDVYGNIIGKTTPAGGVWSYEYDLRDRLVRATTPVVTLTHPDAGGAQIQHQAEWAYSGDHVISQRFKNIDEQGNVGTPTWIETTRSFDTDGRLEVIEQDFRTSGSGTEQARVELSYDPRGFVTEERYKVADTPASYAIKRNEYDARGLVLRTIAEPDYDASPGNGNEISVWFRYDHAARAIDRVHGVNTNATQTSYDVYGRIAWSETPEVSLGDDVNDDPIVGRILREFEFDDAFRLAGEKTTSYQTIGQDPEESNVVAWKIHDRDQAGRLIRLWEARVIDPVDPDVGTLEQIEADWSQWEVDLYASGEIMRRYTPGEEFGSSDFVRVELDELDRITEVESASQNLVTHSYYGPGGARDSTSSQPWDETSSSRPHTYTRNFSYDELGRRTKSTYLGDGTLNPTTSTHYAYDGMGRLVREWQEEGATERIAKETQYNLAGLIVDRQQGEGLGGPSPVLQHVQYAYDLRGRLVRESHVDGASVRSTVYARDGLGRIVQEDRPARDAGATPPVPRTWSRSYQQNTMFLETETDPNGVTKTWTRNGLGQTLEVDVTMGPTPPAHITGPTKVELSYGGESGCGCSSTLLPTLIKTTGGLESTTVQRKFDARNNVIEESITVGACPTLTTRFHYTAVGQCNRVEYPDATSPTVQTVAGAILEREYRPDGMTRKLLWDDDEDPETAGVDLVGYEYFGMQVAVQDNYRLDNDVHYAQGTSSFGPSGSVSEVIWRDPNANPSDDVIVRTKYQRDSFGHVLARLQPNEDEETDTTNELWMHVFHEGPGWLSGFTWDDGATPRSGTAYAERAITRNGFGEISTVQELGTIVPPTETNLWAYHRDDAGFYDPTFTAETVSLGEQVLKYDANDDETTPPYVEERILDRVHLFDDAGNRFKAAFEYQRHNSLGSPCVADDIHEETWEWSLESDAWGRSVRGERTRERQPSSSDCNGSLPTYTYQSEYDYVFDGLGRLVYFRERPDATNPDPDVTEAHVFFAYEGRDIIASAVRDSACDLDSIKETYHPGFDWRPSRTPGQERNKTPGGGGGCNGGPGGGSCGEELAYYTYDDQGGAGVWAIASPALPTGEYWAGHSEGLPTVQDHSWVYLDGYFATVLDGRNVVTCPGVDEWPVEHWPGAADVSMAIAMPGVFLEFEPASYYTVVLCEEGACRNCRAIGQGINVQPPADVKGYIDEAWNKGGRRALELIELLGSFKDGVKKAAEMVDTAKKVKRMGDLAGDIQSSGRFFINGEFVEAALREFKDEIQDALKDAAKNGINEQIGEDVDGDGNFDLGFQSYDPITLGKFIGDGLIKLFMFRVPQDWAIFGMFAREVCDENGNWVEQYKLFDDSGEGGNAAVARGELERAMLRWYKKFCEHCEGFNEDSTDPFDPNGELKKGDKK